MNTGRMRTSASKGEATNIVLLPTVGNSVGYGNALQTVADRLNKLIAATPETEGRYQVMKAVQILIQALVVLRPNDELSQNIQDVVASLAQFDDIAEQSIAGAQAQAREYAAELERLTAPEIIPAETIEAEIRRRQEECDRLMLHQETAEEAVEVLRASLSTYDQLQALGQASPQEQAQAALVSKRLEAHDLTVRSRAGQIEDLRQSIVRLQNYVRAVELVRQGLPAEMFGALLG